MDQPATSNRPTPVKSAKEAINARAKTQAQPEAPLAKSAKEVFNNAARVSEQNSKSASRLHHGSIQKSVESVRTSASAILRMAKSPAPTPPADTSQSADPLAKTTVPVKKTKKSAKAAEDNSVPVVRTSLKLGTAARPARAPMVLPPHARMAASARPLQSATSELDVVQAFEESLSTPARNNALEAAIRSARGLKSGRQSPPSLSAALAASHDELSDYALDTPALEPPRSRTHRADEFELIPVHTNSAKPARATKANSAKTDSAAAPSTKLAHFAPPRHAKPRPQAQPQSSAHSSNLSVAAAPARRSGLRDPQILHAPRPLQRAAESTLSTAPVLADSAVPITVKHTAKSAQTNQAVKSTKSSPAKPTSAAEAVSVQLGQPSNRRFRPAPKDYATPEPKALHIYGMLDTEEPKKKPARPISRRPQPAEPLGVVEDYRPLEYPVKAAGKAPSKPAADPQPVPVGLGPDDPTPPATTRFESTGFSAPEPEPPLPASTALKTSDRDRYALGERSPFFLKTVNVEKRPLSEGPVRTARPTIDRLGIQPNFTPEPEVSGRKKRKNVYPKRKQRKAAQSAKAPLPSKPTVIIPDSHRSKVPLFFLIIFTIILGALVGAAAYLCFFQ